MCKKIVSITLSVFFLLFITAPSIILLADDTSDISITFNLSEEETKDIDLHFFEINLENDIFSITTKKKKTVHFYKKYTKPYLDFISPPPEFIS